MDVVIRLASLDDASALLNVENQCFVTDKIPRRQMRYLLSKGKTRVWLAEYQGNVLGYALMFVPKHPRPARLYSLAVLAESRGLQIGNKLLNAALSDVKQLGYDKAVLEVRNSHHVVQQLYRKFGFSPVKTIEDYYQDGEAALKMAANLD
ncbi:GNAT family N-acetyltransferase [Neptunicella marina]|uniref:GNAT family N-acetyltransferase n=1 Tax=Neptunicella marina TaxID=2125989 RepID=A0A8J6J1C7_9ALTE|nr:N-acetyltransferase [Neptunicella marina]MBC3767792.1 GNAT family N-acetyltransferase [Neptunicella marina]